MYRFKPKALRGSVVIQVEAPLSAATGSLIAFILSSCVAEGGF